MFDFFKKKKEQPPQEAHYDPTRIRVTDIRKGFILDYDFKTWEVSEEMEYDWGNNFFSYEYKLDSGTETCYMMIEESEKVHCFITNKLRFSRLDESVERELRTNERPPRQITLDGIVYYREKEAPGFFRHIEEAPEDSIEFIRWYYFDQSEKNVLMIDQWEVDDYEASAGKILPENAISNILPKSS